jgi:hypothetical protein
LNFSDVPRTTGEFALFSTCISIISLLSRDYPFLFKRGVELVEQLALKAQAVVNRILGVVVRQAVPLLQHEGRRVLSAVQAAFPRRTDIVVCSFHIAAFLEGFYQICSL